jgi:signal transduction histidine kinase
MINDLNDRISNRSILLIAIFSLPLNIIIYFALKESEFQIIRIVPPVFSLISILLALFRYKIEFRSKIWAFIGLMFCTAWFNLLLGLLDLASLWFIMAIIYSLFISQNKQSLIVYIAAFVSILVVGILMMTQLTFIPLKYNFENCHYPCVTVRILHFLLISSIIYYILNLFISTNRSNVKHLQAQAADLQEANKTLQKEMKEKKELQDQLLEAVILTEEKERKRIASDLHDGLGPVLSAVNLFFEAYIDAPTGTEKNNIETKLKVIINDAIADVSRISHNISPHILENYGLTAALKTFIDQLNNSDKIKIELRIDNLNRFELKHELTVYRTITELINNTIKHANSNSIEICFEQTGDILKIRYEDEGSGFSKLNTLNDNNGMGIQNIQNRIESLGGNITFSNAENGGMKALISIPYKETAADEKH